MSGGGNEFILILIQIMDQNRLELFLWNSKNISDSQDWEVIVEAKKKVVIWWSKNDENVHLC
jgi:hypothetical protein